MIGDSVKDKVLYNYNQRSILRLLDGDDLNIIKHVTLRYRSAKVVVEGGALLDLWRLCHRVMHWHPLMVWIYPHKNRAYYGR